MIKVLFVCTGNTCRSPMAKAIFNDACSKNNLDFTADSAGVATVSGLAAADNAVKALNEIGIDLSEHRSKFLPEVDLFSYDYICVMNYNQAEILQSMGVLKNKIYILQSDKKTDEKLGKYDFEIGISDPYGGDLSVYKKCRDELISAVNIFINKLKQL